MCVYLRKYNEYICIITSPVTCALMLSNELEWCLHVATDSRNVVLSQKLLLCVSYVNSTQVLCIDLTPQSIRKLDVMMF